MSDIHPDQLGQLFEALDEQLASRGAREHLVVIGGSGLVAMGLAKRSTQDVDVVGLVRGTKIEVAQPLPAPVVDSAAAVARDFRLMDSWLNAGPSSLLTTGGGLPSGFMSRAQTVVYGPALSVTFASRTDQICFKLYAFADRGYARDAADLRGLVPNEHELRAAAEWVETQNAPGPFDERVAQVLVEFGVVRAPRGA